MSVEVEWTAEEEAAFAEGIKAFRKNFAQISRLYVPSKTVHDVIAYYYRCVLGPISYPPFSPGSEPLVLLFLRLCCAVQALEGIGGLPCLEEGPTLGAPHQESHLPRGD